MHLLTTPGVLIIDKDSIFRNKGPAMPRRVGIALQRHYAENLYAYILWLFILDERLAAFSINKS